MKKSVLIFGLFVIIVQFTFAQLKVVNSGNVGIQVGTSTPLSTLAIGGVGSTLNKVDITGNSSTTTALNVSQPNTMAGTTNYGILSTIGGGYYTYIGVKGQVTITGDPIYVGKSYGVLGIAGNHTYGYNYGVYGTVTGTHYGAGIVGTTYGTLDVYVPGTYAGYFDGNVGVTGTINGVTISNSDIRYKKNIVELNTKKSLDNILQMVPIEYNLKQMYNETKGDSTITKKGLYNENSQVFQKKHYGLIAQDLQKLYPDLVYQNDSGYLSVNYIGIIPLLIESIKELKSEIDVLSTTNSGLKKIGATNISFDEPQSAAVLFQNNPNPFSKSTHIEYYLPETVQNALLCIYNLQGKQLKQITITERGNGTQTISASEFTAGIYLYGLIADGNEVDVKKMILTN